MALGGIDPIVASAYLGPWGGLAATWASLAAAAAIVIAIARRRGVAVRPSRALLIGAVLIGVLSIAVFAAGGHPWSVTFGFTVWGGKIATLLGFDLSGTEFWQWPGPKRALGDSILSDTSSLTDLGMILGAMAAAAAAKPFARGAWPPLKSLARRRHRRPADGLGRAARLRLQHRRLRRRRGVGLAARLGLVCGGARRLHDRHSTAAAGSACRGSDRDAARLCDRTCGWAWRGAGGSSVVAVERPRPCRPRTSRAPARHAARRARRRSANSPYLP